MGCASGSRARYTRAGYFELVLRIFSVWNIVVFAPGLSYLQELPWVEASFANRTYVLLFVQAVVFGVV